MEVPSDKSALKASSVFGLKLPLGDVSWSLGVLTVKQTYFETFHIIVFLNPQGFKKKIFLVFFK